MCEHHEHNHNKKSPVKRIIAALTIFAAAMIFHFDEPLRFAIFFAAYLLAGADVVLRAVKNIFKGNIFDENFLMSIATAGALAIREYPEAVMVMVLYQIGEYFQHRAVEKSRHSIKELMDIRPDYANLEKEGRLIKCAPNEVKAGDIIVVKTGEKIPLDGDIIDGSASLDTAALTGESAPKKVSAGDTAISGCINLDGYLKIKVTKPFSESTVSKILQLVEHAGAKKAKTENFITKFARYYTPAVVAGAVVLALLPPLVIEGAEFSVWFQRALTFLVISCPCALVISVPLSFFGGIGGASKCGILIKGSSYLELLANPDTIVFDKTGTLTKGVFKVTEIHPENISKEELLKYTALAESASAHPIGASIREAYGKSFDCSEVNEIEDIAGNGIKAVVNGKQVLAGNSKLLERYHISHEIIECGATVVYTAIDGRYSGYIVISDEVKDDAKAAVCALKKYAKNITILTGDTLKAAQNVQRKLCADTLHAELLPDEKVEKLEEIIAAKENGKSVIFTGDGINDAPVLTRADVGIAMGALGSDAAIEAADVVIMDDKPSKIAAAIEISRKTLRIVKQNIVFALGIKALFLILGASGMVTMWGAVFADVGVAVIAILNAMRTLNVREYAALPG